MYYKHICVALTFLLTLRGIQTKAARFFRCVLSVPERSHKQKNAGRRMNTSAVIGLDVITC